MATETPAALLTFALVQPKRAIHRLGIPCVPPESPCWLAATNHETLATDRRRHVLSFLEALLFLIRVPIFDFQIKPCLVATVVGEE